MKNSADLGGCYSPGLRAEVENTLRDLQNSSYPMKAKFNDIQNISPFLKEFCHFALCLSAHQT